MSQTVLEINSKLADKKNDDGSYFSQVFGEPLLCRAGSTIDFLNGFIDLGKTSVDDYIYIPNKIRLGINFYRYEYDVPQLPATQGVDQDAHSKRFIYFYPAEQDAASAPDAIIIDQPIYDPNTQTPNDITQYGAKSSFYGNTNLPAFLNKRISTGTTAYPPDAQNPYETIVRTETFICEEETAFIDINSGYYSKVKFCQLVNDAFNLIQGSLVNNDKPLETKTPNTTVPKYYEYDVAPVDYQIFPNAQNDLLKSYEYPHHIASVVGPDPNALTNKTNIYVNDLTWNYWFIPAYTVPADLNYFVEEFNPPYVWYNDKQTGFMAGTAKFNLNYDADNDLFYIDYIHTPILDTQQREVVLFSKSIINYSAKSNTGYKVNGSMGGCLISRLFSNAFDDAGNVIDSNTGFWQNILGFGFDDAYQAQFKADFVTETSVFYNNAVQQIGNQLLSKYGITYEFVSTHPNLKYMPEASTIPLVPIQWLQQSNFTDVKLDKGMAIYSTDIPKIFQSIGNRVIYGDKLGAFRKPDPYYLLDINISHLKNDNYRDRDSFRQIMSIAGKTYNSGTNYIQLFADNSIQALNLFEDIYIDKIEIKILNADKTLATGLGDSTSIFLRLTQPVIVEKK